MLFFGWFYYLCSGKDREQRWGATPERSQPGTAVLLGRPTGGAFFFEFCV